MEFIAIDFETADFTRYSPCEIGITEVVDMEIVSQKSFLIKPLCYPKFDDFNVSLHGITPKMVEGSKNFKELYNEELRDIIEGKLVICHNTAFDLGVLRETLAEYDEVPPRLNYLCTLTLARRYFSSLVSYNLGNVANYLGVSPFKSNHRALLDSEITAKIAIEIFKRYNVKTLEDISSCLKYNLGSFSSDTYTGFTHKRKRESIYDLLKREVESDVSLKIDSNSFFFDKNVVFTGKMSSMTRIEAAKIVIGVGGSFFNSLTAKTDILVVGQQDARVVGEQGESKKQKAAQKLKDNGQNIEVLSEIDFLQFINT